MADTTKIGAAIGEWWGTVTTPAPAGVGVATRPGLQNSCGGKSAPRFPNLKDHARRHGEGEDPEEYYHSAWEHTRTGRRFKVRHDGRTKYVYLTRLGPDEFLFTSGSLSGKAIFTHYRVNGAYLRNKGITLPKGF